MPSIFGSAVYEMLKLSFFDRKLSIFFSKFNKSSLLKALARESIGTLCKAFLKFFDGLYPTVFIGEFFDFKNLCFISKSTIFLFNSSYSESVISEKLSL